ncbi:MAG: ATP phosphoribosyltransferase [Mariprofundaceae bacterium]|nr:ATP phosphoribosyltransferase [Mariprofundaceae bacterium]
MAKQIITIALAKGRILQQTLPLLKQAGLMPEEDVLTTRKLMLDGPRIGDWLVRFLIIRAADVCTYVVQGAADMGIVGQDILLESRPNVYAPLDLEIGRCRLCVAGVESLVREGMPKRGTRIRVATKYDYLTAQYYRRQGLQSEIIHLYGSMELAPLVGIADRIVDVVETGATLQANGLIEELTLFHISSRLIINPASAVTRSLMIKPLIAKLREAVHNQRKKRTP